jgi:small subunit ribosomal protein S6
MEVQETLRTYELFCLLKAGFDIESNDQTIANIEKSIIGFGGKIISTNKMGRKRLAYDIKRNRDSFCVTFIIELDSARVKELKRYLKLNENVLRDFVTVTKPGPVGVAANA